MGLKSGAENKCPPIDEPLSRCCLRLRGCQHIPPATYRLIPRPTGYKFSYRFWTQICTYEDFRVFDAA